MPMLSAQTAPSTPSPGLGRLCVIAALLASLALHAVGIWLVRGSRPHVAPQRRAPIDIEVMRVSPKAVAKAGRQAAPTPQAKRTPRATTPRPAAARPSATLPQTAPQPAAAAPPKAAAAPMHIGLSLSSTTASGAVSAAVGGPQGTADASAGAQGSLGTAGSSAGASETGSVVQSFALTEPPEVDVEPNLRDYYPPQAARDALEAQVILALSIDATGKVVRASVVRSGGLDFDAAARRAALERLHFKAARQDGRAVATQINYTLTFLLD